MGNMLLRARTTLRMIVGTNDPQPDVALDQNNPGPQYAFRKSMFEVFCNSHHFTQLAASFIDTRAE